MSAPSWVMLIYEIETKKIKSFVKIEPSSVVGDVINENVPRTAHVKSVLGFRSAEHADKKTDKVELPSDMPGEALVQFGVKVIYVECLESVEETQKSLDKNAFDVLMELKKKYDWLPPEKSEPKNNKETLYNHVLDVCRKKFQIGFQERQKEVGLQITNTLTEVLWYIDPFHDKFRSRSINIPEEWRLTGFRDWKAQHKKVPVITEEELFQRSDKLAKVLMFPWWMNTKFSAFKDSVTGLLTAIEAYLSHLKKQQGRTEANHRSHVPVRSVSDHWGLQVIEANISHATAVPHQYAAVMAKLENVSPYEEISLLEYEPTSSSERRKWRKGILTYFKCKVALFTVSFGNFLGTGQWIWKHPENESTEKEISVVNRIKNSLPKFSTRAIRKNFFEQYGTVMKPCELRSVFFELTDYQYACENAASEEVDERFLKFISSCDDEEVVVDLRKYNGRMADTKFDPFWKELGTYLDEWTAVNDRRETSTSYLPLAISVEDLRTFVLKRLPADTPAPSASWIRLNFMPSSQFRASAQHYTGKFDVKYAVQQRLLRAQHEDAPYALHLWYMLKDMVVKYRDFSRLQCLDDKAIIPVGEPGKPVATGVRSHHRAMVVGNQSSLKCLDHDYHLAGIVASVALTVEIPESSRDSFYKGTVHVTVKDKVFQASSPLRHATENRNIVLENYTDDGVNLDRPILFRYTDGGPDHRTTYKSVKTACLLEFICLDLDMLICVRTAPNQSYNNPAERIMALLNLGLQNSALCRTEMSEGFEMQAKRLNSLASIRNYAEKNKVFKEAYKDSMVGPCSVVSDRFKRLSLKGESVKVHRPAEKEEIEALCEMIKIIDETFPLEKINDYQSSAAVKDFLEKHSQMRQYSFQMKKCKSNQCGYCVLNPPRLPHEVFDELHFLPDPIPDGDNHYKPFNEVYGTETVDNHRPSLKLRPELSDRDKKHKSLFVAAKVRGYVQCFDCGKRRVVYAAKKFTYIEQQRLSRVKEEKLYVCGSTLFPGLDLQDVVVVKEGQNCQSPIETTYYADVNNKMEDICFYCGCAENLADNPALHDLREQFGTVRPICEACWVSGKEPSTRNKRVNNKRAKKK